MRHYARYNNEEFIVLGHNPKYNNCLMVRMVALPMEEQADLRAIATSEVAQNHHYYLMPVLMTQTHRSGRSWDQYLLEQVNRRGGPVLTLPLKDIQDSLDPEQKAVWKGYGKPATRSPNLNPSADLTADGRRLQEAYHPGSSRHPAGTAVAPPMIPADVLAGLPLPEGAEPVDGFADRAGMPVRGPDKFDVIKEAIADEGRQTRESLDRLSDVLERMLTVSQDTERPKTKPRKGEEN